MQATTIVLNTLVQGRGQVAPPLERATSYWPAATLDTEHPDGPDHPGLCGTLAHRSARAVRVTRAFDVLLMS